MAAGNSSGNAQAWQGCRALSSCATTSRSAGRRLSVNLAIGKGMEHTRGSPAHPQTQGKIERWHQTLKNRILLENYFLPGDLERQIAAFVEHYNHSHYHESLGNLTLAEVSQNP